jgi:hypothetical protein
LAGLGTALLVLSVLAGRYFTTTPTAPTPATQPPALPSVVPPSDNGVLHITSDVAVDIHLDGNPAKLTTPLTRTLAPGSHDVTVVFRASSKRLQRQITIRPGETVRLRLVSRATPDGG